jgi:TRAP-type C4-dicarboxylate transport system substrate-binding protein
VLVDSYALERSVIASGLPARMLDALDGLHVSGLAVLAGGLRRPIAVKRPLLSPSDWRGITFATVRSLLQAQAVRALGARVSNRWGAPLGDDVSNGGVQGGAADSFALDRSDLLPPAKSEGGRRRLPGPSGRPRGPDIERRLHLGLLGVVRGDVVARGQRAASARPPSGRSGRCRAVRREAVAQDRLRRIASVALALAAAAFAAGCGGGAGAEKSGGPIAPVVLELADGYNPGLELEPAVGYFVGRVGELSRGELRIHVVDDWAGNTPGMEQRIVRDVAAGKADLGWVGTRVFDTLGVNDFQALTAPMLIDSYALERAVIASDIPKQMLGGLEKAGVTGLGVLGGGLRRPISLRRPLLQPADWRGITFAVFRSRGQTEAIRALGARTTDVWGPALQDAVAQHRVDGFEKHYFIWDFVIYPGVVPYAAANVSLWPETAALLANPHRLAGLTEAQRSWLGQAAADAAARSTALFENEAPQIVRLCKEGARFRDASSADLAALRRAFAPVYASLEQDPRTKELIGRIEELKRTTHREPEAVIPPSCGGQAPGEPAATAARTDPTVLNGVYRVTWTDRELAAIGPVAKFARPSYGGVITLAMHDGRYRFQPGTPPACTGTYTVSASTVRFRVDAATYCQGVVTARWSFVGGQLVLDVISATNPYDQIIWGRKPWREIG